jgi:hypothetical protein
MRSVIPFPIRRARKFPFKLGLRPSQIGTIAPALAAQFGLNSAESFNPIASPCKAPPFRSCTLAWHRTCLRIGQFETAPLNPFQQMKTSNQLGTLATSLSLIILALGFSAFGFIPLINKQPIYTSNIFSAENAYSFIGSSFSILVGATFLVAAISFRVVRARSERLVAQLDPSLL